MQISGIQLVHLNLSSKQLIILHGAKSSKFETAFSWVLLTRKLLVQSQHLHDRWIIRAVGPVHILRRTNFTTWNSERQLVSKVSSSLFVLFEIVWIIVERADVGAWLLSEQSIVVVCILISSWLSM